MLCIIQCDPSVPPGMVLSAAVEKGLRHEVWKPWEGRPLPDADSFSGLIILGGRMGAGDEGEYPFLAGLKELIREVTWREKPLLGICLGAQLMAEALGGGVLAGHLGEKGIRDISLTTLGCFDPLFEKTPYNFVSFHWHFDSFVLPEGSVLLATGKGCPPQAFRYGARAYGVQFHPEVTLEIVEEWAREENDGEVVARFKTFERQHTDHGRALLGSFLRL